LGFFVYNSFMKRPSLLTLTLLLIIAAFIISVALRTNNSSRENYQTAEDLRFDTPIRVGNSFFSVFFATTVTQRARGLSGIKSLTPAQGLLMVFNAEDKWGIWMKDMNFPIDIVWFTTDGTIFYIKENISPQTFPEVFAPPASARYVLELSAGAVKNSNLKIGDLLLY